MIKIPKPCHENWNKMTPNEKGRFCSSCQKTVVDFTQMSQDEILNYLKRRSSEKVCGRVRLDHLAQNNPLVVPPKSNLPIFKVAAVASMTLLMVNSVTAQTDSIAFPEVEIENIKGLMEPIPAKLSPKGDDQRTKKVTVQLWEPSGEPLMFANVAYIENDSVITGATADLEGKAILQLSEEMMRSGYLEVSFVGYKPQIILFEPDVYSYELTFEEQDMHLSGELVVVGGLEIEPDTVNLSKKRFWNKNNPTDSLAKTVEDSLSKECSIEASVFPNPCTDFFTLNLPTNSQGTLTVNDSKGNRVLSKQITSSQTKVNLQSYASGTYYITVHNEDGKLMYNSKVVKK